MRYNDKMHYLFFIAFIAIIHFGCSSFSANKQNSIVDKLGRDYNAYRNSDWLERKLMMVPIAFQGEYPHIIDSLKLQKIYDATKWDIYCLACKDTCDFPYNKDTIRTKFSFSLLDLKYEGYKLSNDTFQLFFGFYNANKKRCDRWSCGQVFPIHGSAVILGHNTLFGYLDFNGTWSPLYLRKYVNKGILYIRKHPSELNPWLYKEAEKRGFLDKKSNN